MINFELAFILTLRKIHLPSGLRKADLEALVGDISPEESQYLEIWKNIAKNIGMLNPPLYLEYSASDLKSFLEIKTNFGSNLPLSYYLPKKDKEHLLAYYILYNYPITFTNKEWTIEQSSAINFVKGILVVNSSAGTGKTSCANEKAFRLRDEGVLVISYTNEAINENYKRIHEYPGLKGLLGRKDYEKKLNITTADSLATRIVGAVGLEGHDISIRTAIEYLQNNTDIYYKFMIPGRGLFYNHIIVDECQDIDDLRGELLITFFRMFRLKSLTLFGDPRQRVREGCGLWYTKLWDQSYQFLELPDRNIPSIERIGFTYSYRFQNALMLNLANSLSERRSNIHFPLQSHSAVAQIPETTPIELILGNNEDSVIELVALYIRDVLKISYNQICIIGPSLTKENKTSAIAQKIFSIFKEYNISCYTRAEGSYQPNAVLFSTIQSVKGKEFDYIFVFGINNYPNSFYMIPYDEAESLIFVLHTRARKKIFYIGCNNFVIPRGIDAKYVSNYTAPLTNTNRIWEPEPHVLKIWDIVLEKNLINFLRINDFCLTGEVIDTLPSISSLNDKFWGNLAVLAIQMLIKGEHLDILKKFASGQSVSHSPKEYENLKRKNIIVKGKYIVDKNINNIIICNTAVNLPKDTDIIYLQEILQKPVDSVTLNDYIHLTKICDYLYGEFKESGATITNNNNDTLISTFQKIASEIKEKYSEIFELEIYPQNLNLIGIINLCSNTHIIEFNTLSTINDQELYLKVWLNYLANDDKNKKSIIINLQTGKVIQINSNNSFERWQYIMEAYFQIRTHVELVNFRVTQATCTSKTGGLIPKTFPHNTFLVDTEFASSLVGNRQENEIFDLACVNINDPYCSLVQTIKPKDENLAFATSWLNKPAELFISSPSMKEITDNIFYSIQRLYVTHDVDLQYYISPVDVSWYKEIQCKKTNLGSVAREIALKNGIFISGSQPPKLGDLYSQLCKPLEFQPHLHQHTALSDALMLYEMKRLNII